MRPRPLVRLAPAALLIHLLWGAGARAATQGDAGSDAVAPDATVAPADAGAALDGGDAAAAPADAAPPPPPPPPPLPPPLPPPPVAMPQRLEELTVVGTSEARTAGSAHVLKPRDLQRLRYDNVESVVKEVPGVYARGEDGFGLRPNIGIRGTAPDRSKKVTLMEDGILFGPAPYSAPASYYFPLVTRMEWVRVIKGPGAIVFGPQTVGGAIDFVTLRIPYDEVGFVDLAGGQYGYGMFHGAYGVNTERSGYVIEGVHLRSSGFKQLDGGGDTGFGKNEWMWKGRYQLSNNPNALQEVRLKLGYADEDSRESYLGLSDADFRATPLRRYAASQLDHMAWHRTQIVASYHAEFARAFTLDVAAYRNDFSRTWRKVNHIGGTRIAGNDGYNTIAGETPISDVLADPTSGRNALLYSVLTGASDTSGADDKIYVGPNRRLFVSQGIQAVGGWHGASGPVTHRVEASARLHYDRIDRQHTEDGFLMQGGKLVWDGLGTITTSDERGWTYAVAMHATDAISYGRFTVTPGVRVELISMWLRDRMAGTEVKSTPQRLALPGIGGYAALTPSFGSAGRRLPRLLARDPRAAEHRAPRDQRQLRGGGPLDQPALEGRGDRLLQRLPEPHQLLRGGEGSVGAPSDMQANAGGAHIWGAELYANGDVVRGPRLVVPVTVAYTHTRSKLLETFTSGDPTLGDVKPGYELPYVPRNQLFASAALETPRTSLALGATYVSAMREIAGTGPTLPTKPRTDASLLFDITARLRVAATGQVYLSVRNLFDAADIAARLPFGARPNAPRWVQIGTRWSF